jgi:hypothetical protein
MNRHHLFVDGMLSGTGIRDADAGGYVEPNRLGLSPILLKRVADWLLKYENAHYYQFADAAENRRLDQEGIEITREMRKELPDSQIEYFSNAEMKRIHID